MKRGIVQLFVLWSSLCAVLPDLGQAQPQHLACVTLSYYDQGSGRKLGWNTSLEKNILDQTNAERWRHGLPALTISSHLTVAAQKHAINMARLEETAHTLGKQGPGERLKAVGYKWSSLAENLAAGYVGAKEVVFGWMDSQSHRSNILDTAHQGYTQTGVGAHLSTSGQWYYAQVFAKPSFGHCYR